MSLKTDVESLLFAVGRRITVEEIVRYLRVRDTQKVLEALEELKADYDAKQGSIVIVKEDGSWKMTVRDDMLPIVRKVVSKTELPKGVMETLAIIAFKAPVLQSDIVKVRTNKAYDHLAMLEDLRYVTREKKGRTKLIKLSTKFFDYFDVPEAALKQRFGNVAALENAIVEKEAEIAAASARQSEAQATHKVEEERYKKEMLEKHRQIDEELAKMPEVDLVDDEGHPQKLETYESRVYDITEKPVLPSAFEIVDEPEIFKVPQQKQAPAPVVEEPEQTNEDVLHDENAAPEERAEAIKEILNPEAPPTAPPPDEDTFAPGTVEFEAQKVAKTLESREVKGLFSEGMTAEIEAEIDEKVSAITGEHEKKPVKKEDDDHEDIEPETAADVHVSPEEGEKEERKSGGPDPHAHPDGK